MKKYVCSICGYVYNEDVGTKWEDISGDWVCPLCGAAKGAFMEESTDEGAIAEVHEIKRKKNDEVKAKHKKREVSEDEISTICSNLAKGCEKQYLADEAKAFWELSKYYQQINEPTSDEIIPKLLEGMNATIAKEYKEANVVAVDAEDRGSQRALLWSEKVTKMLKSILTQYEKLGDSYLEGKKVYVCEICGFVSIGNSIPKICPICKVPNVKIKEIRRV